MSSVTRFLESHFVVHLHLFEVPDLHGSRLLNLSRVQLLDGYVAPEDRMFGRGARQYVDCPLEVVVPLFLSTLLNGLLELGIACHVLDFFRLHALRW